MGGCRDGDTQSVDCVLFETCIVEIYAKDITLYTGGWLSQRTMDGMNMVRSVCPGMEAQAPRHDSSLCGVAVWDRSAYSITPRNLHYMARTNTVIYV